MIRIEHLEKEFPGGGKVLKDINAEIRDGDVIALIGPSGTGKSTLLRCINMLGAPTGGRIFIDDKEITSDAYPLEELHKKTGMVFQSFNLFEHYSVIENLMLPQVKVYHRDKQESYDKAMSLLQSVGMAAKKNAYPSQLSGGQKQRVAIARTLAMDPEIILFDEPTSALDPASVDEVKTVIRDVTKGNVTALIVTHDMDFARTISNRVFYMDQGIIYEEGSPEDIFENPQRDRTKRFVRKVYSLEAEVAEKSFDYQGLMSKISMFGLNNKIDHDLIYRMQLITEELLCSVLFPAFTVPFKVHLLYSYNPGDKSTIIEVGFSGEKLNMVPDNVDLSVINDGKTLSLKIIRHMVKEYSYGYDDSEKEYRNRLRLEL